MLTTHPVSAAPTAGPRHALGHPLDAVEAKARRARRWALRAWAVLGVGVLAAGSAYAAGLPSVGGTTGAGSVDEAAVRTVDYSGAAAGAPVYSDKIAKVADITYTWSQKNAAIGDTGMFFVDLAAAPAGTYAVEVFLAGVLDPNWSAYQLQVGVVPATSSADCATADYASAAPHVLYTDTTEVSVLLPDLASGSGYCVGAPAAPADGVSTLLRRTRPNVTPAYPTFSALVAKTA